MAVVQQVWKYIILTPDTTIQMPRWATILTAGHQDGTMCLWALVDPKQEKQPRRFRVFGTGMPITEESLNHGPSAYVGTVQIDNMVWHVFEVAP